MASADATDHYYNKLSKALSAVLRHTGQRDGLYFTRGGFARLRDIFDLQLLRMKSVPEQDVYEVAYTSFHNPSCPRFEIITGPDQQDWIRSKRRHSIASIRASLPAEILWQDVEEAKASRRRFAQQQKEDLDAIYARWQDEPKQEAQNGASRQEPAAPIPAASQHVGRAKCDFNGWEFADETCDGQPYLTLHKGEFVIFLSAERHGWYWGRSLVGNAGWFPKVYCEPAQTYLVEEAVESRTASPVLRAPSWEDGQVAAPATSSSAGPRSTYRANSDHPRTETSYSVKASPAEESTATQALDQSNAPLFQASWPAPCGPPTSYGPNAPVPRSADPASAWKAPPPPPPMPPSESHESQHEAPSQLPPHQASTPVLPPASQRTTHKAAPPQLPARKAPPPNLPKAVVQPNLYEDDRVQASTNSAVPSRSHGQAGRGMTDASHMEADQAEQPVASLGSEPSPKQDSASSTEVGSSGRSPAFLATTPTASVRKNVDPPSNSRLLHVSWNLGVPQVRLYQEVHEELEPEVRQALSELLEQGSCPSQP